MFFTRKKIKISYGITVCNEAVELSKLLTMLIPIIDEDDEVMGFEEYTHWVGKEIGVESGGDVVHERRTYPHIDAKATRTLRGRRVS